MMRLLFFIFALIFAVWLGLIIKSDPGYMLMAVHHWTIEMPLWLGVVLIILAYLIIFWLVRFLACLFGIPERVRFWSNRRRIRKAHRKTHRGLIALAEGNWVASEKLLVQAAATTDTPLINYLAAARGAQARGAYERRDNYLRQAIAVNPDAEIAVGLTQAQLQLDHQQLEQALATLKHLRELEPNHKYVLKLLQQLYCQLNDWSNLQELLPELRKYKVLSTDELEQLSLKIYQQRLEAANKENLDASKIWQALPRYQHFNPMLVANYIPYLLKQNQNEAAEQLIRDTLKKNWDEHLLLMYADIPSIDHKKQLTHAENWLKYHKNNATLLYVLGKLCLSNQLWGKARSYFEASLGIKPTIACYQVLANLFEKLGDNKLAMEYYKQGQKLCLSEAP